MKNIVVAILVVCAGITSAQGQTQENRHLRVAIANPPDEEPIVIHDPRTNFRITSLLPTLISSEEAGAILRVHLDHFSPDRAGNKDGREVIMMISSSNRSALPSNARLAVKTEKKLYALDQGFPPEYKRSLSSVGEDHSALITLPDFMEIVTAKSVKILVGDKIVLDWPSDKLAKLKAMARAIQ